MKRIGFCVSGRGTGVRAAIEAAREGLIEIEPAVVVCDRPSPLVETARALGAPAVEHAYESFPDRSLFEAAVDESIAAARCDWLMLNYNRLVPKSTIDLVEGRVLNLHMSLLPLFTGFGALKKALASGMKVAGVTIHQVDHTIDAGAIAAQAAAPILPEDDEQSLGWRLFQIALPLQLQVLRDIARGRISLEGETLVVQSRFETAGGFAPAIDDDVASFAKAFCANISAD